LLRSVDDAQTDLADLATPFYRIPELAWERYNTQLWTQRGIFNLRVQADVVHSFMCHFARELLTGQPGVTLSSPDAQTLTAEIRRRFTWRMRLHKFNDDLSVPFNDTILGLEFIEQLGQLTLEEEPTNLHLGYRLNPTRSGMAGVHVVCPSSEDQIEWQYAVQRPDDGSEPTPFPAPAPLGPRPRLRPGEAADAPRRTGDSGA
jgi:hypothetical protein